MCCNIVFDTIRINRVQPRAVGVAPEEGSAMSQRTRTNRQRKPGVAAQHKPPRHVRQVEHRRVRRAAHVGLATMEEPEDLTLPRPVHTAVKTDPSERPEVPITSRRFKVWKTKAWKRRTLERAQRAEAYRQLA